jgi:zinc/manganese transport system substrate-binding protein
MLTRRLALAVLAAFAAPPAVAQSEKIPVVASFTILADFVREIGGDRVNVVSLVGPNGDPHVYDPTPADSRTVAAARLVVENGLGLEGWIDRLIKVSGTKARIVVATAGVTPRKDMSNPEFAERGGIDPHAWQSIGNARIYVADIRDALSAVDPAGKADYESRAKSYLARLDALEAEVRGEIAKIPAERRRLVTTHDAFGYFGQAYGVALVAPAGVSTESEISARDVAKIIRQIRADKFPAVFLENIADPRLMDRIARESGAKVGGKLFSDALSPPDGPAGTYIDMVRHNIRELTKALAP